MDDATIIAAQTTFEGKLSGEGSLAVHGTLRGDLDLSQRVTVGPTGHVNGEVTASEVVIEGRLQGDIQASQRVILRDGARAVANITAPLVEMDDGAQLRGELNVGVDAEESDSTSSSSSSRRRGSSSRRGSRATPSRKRSTSSPSTAPSSARSASANTSGSSSKAAPASTTTTTTTVEEDDDASSDSDDDSGPALPDGDPQAEKVDVDADTSTDDDQESLDDEVVDEYREDYTVKELRAKLRDRDLRVSGTKDELIERLLTGDDS